MSGTSPQEPESIQVGARTGGDPGRGVFAAGILHGEAHLPNTKSPPAAGAVVPGKERRRRSRGRRAIGEAGQHRKEKDPSTKKNLNLGRVPQAFLGRLPIPLTGGHPAEALEAEGI